MLAYAWPVGLIVLSNIMYQICTKGMPNGVDPFASLTITYAIAAVVSAGLFFVASGGGSLVAEYHKVNWAPFVLGIVIIGLESGFIYGYKAGWQVNTLPLVANTILAIFLIFVGFLLYKEAITVEKLAGIAICLVGLYFINK